MKRNRMLSAGVMGAALVIGPLTVGCLRPRAGDVTFWVVSGDTEVLADTLPDPENEVYSASGRTLRLRAALNETVAVQLVLRAADADADAGPFTLRFTDLRSATDRLAARDAFEVYRAHYVLVDTYPVWYPSHTGRSATPRAWPDKLVPWTAPTGGGPISLRPARNEIVWLDVHVPLAVTPGPYEGHIEIRNEATGEVLGQCAISLTVEPVALPTDCSLPAVCRIDPRDLLAAHLGWPRLSPEQTRILRNDPNHGRACALVDQTMRLFQQHRTTPVLWASFPRFQPLGPRELNIDWQAYDQLVEPWLDGSGFANRAPLALWPVPASLDYPDAKRNGGLHAPEYARILAAYLAECRRHFAERGWLDRAFLRLCPPEPMTQTAVDRVRRVAGIVRQSESGLPLLAHLPPYSLRAFGWNAAPSVELQGIQIWSPPAMWLEPERLAREARLGLRTWFMPSFPPYSGTLHVAAGANDARVLAWQAYRAGSTGLWIEHAADRPDEQEIAAHVAPWDALALVYPGAEHGLPDRPVPSMRLKRLQRGLQDYELLILLERNGRRLLADQIAAQVVRWMGTQACVDNLVTGDVSGWLPDPRSLELARELMLFDLTASFDPSDQTRQRVIRTHAAWAQMMNQARRVRVEARGVRLVTRPAGALEAHVLVDAVNGTDQHLRGPWRVVAPPAGWQQGSPPLMNLPPATRQRAAVDVQLAGLEYDANGVYPFELAWDTDAFGVFRAPARLAVATTTPIETPLRIDGHLGDWPMAANNSAGDFRLLTERRDPHNGRSDLPTLRSRAYFALDRQFLYVALRCDLRPGEPPLWQADNVVHADGAKPWGQDVVEVLLDPRNAPAGTAADVYCVRIKPNGVLLMTRGCPTTPAMHETHTWPADARVAVAVADDVWTVELAIPLTAFEPEAWRNRIWGANVARLDARRGEYASWAAARGSCYAPATLGNLIMVWP